MPERPVNKGQEVKLRIEGLAQGGDGIGRLQGLALFVSGAFPGDLVLARVTEVRKNYARAVVLEVFEPGPGRVRAECPVWRDCGGCSFQGLKYQEQLRYKEAFVREALERIGKIEGVEYLPIIPSPVTSGYRNKAQVPVGEVDGKLVAGFYRKGTHELVPSESCMLQSEANNRVLKTVLEVCHRYGLSAYDERFHRGFLRHILLRSSTVGKVMVVLVTRETRFPEGPELASEVMRECPEVSGVIQNVNPRRTNVILGDTYRTLAGEERLLDRIGDLVFEISAVSFFQVNPWSTDLLYQKVLEFASLKGTETVIDGYCGIGTISLFLAREAGKVYGLEVVAKAVEDARDNAVRNGIHNAEFIAGPLEETLPGLIEKGIRPQLAVLDPPRKGCDREVLRAVAASGAGRIVYVSCNPATLARDLALLRDEGYPVDRVQPVDMFPYTPHVETVVLLLRKHS